MSIKRIFKLSSEKLRAFTTSKLIEISEFAADHSAFSQGGSENEYC